MKTNEQCRRRVEVRVQKQGLQAFYPLLREGVYVMVHTGAPIQDVLCRDLEIPEQVIRQEIQTLFLDGHPVDDLLKTCCTEGSVLSLSAAMPGVFGASMRAKGDYAGMRSSISLRKGDGGSSGSRTGFILLRLFNLTAPRIGPGLLSKGVYAETGRLACFFDGLSEKERSRLNSLRIEGIETDIKSMNKGKVFPEGGTAFLRVLDSFS